jgi:PAS domain-containing protein
MVTRYTSNHNNGEFSDQDFSRLIELFSPQYPASIYVKDAKLRYVFCNDYQLKMAGFTNVNEIQKKTDNELPWHDQADPITNTDKQVLQSKEAIILEERAYLSDGKEAIFLTKKIPWFSKENSDTPIGLIGISIDITQFERSIEEAQAHL